MKVRRTTGSGRPPSPPLKVASGQIQQHPISTVFTAPPTGAKGHLPDSRRVERHTRTMFGDQPSSTYITVDLTIAYTCHCPSLAYKRRRQTPSRGDENDRRKITPSTHFTPRYRHSTRSVRTPGTWRLHLLSRLACSPLLRAPPVQDNTVRTHTLCWTYGRVAGTRIHPRVIALALASTIGRQDTAQFL